ncbi:fumarylacetoacetate hydrolase family protein [Actinomycetospora sp. Odt1-22]|uniref:Fumarylacetoacetate hydrolase family protein n=1 Tax=Actinomycetospora termitidis TaxID=3053470 RepID=A0ABT7MHG0_9PSEU|nr:fumarylacetoacetate hydrolase family protein [Actinomycetospora sp. Odt1-22]MDL5160114.1 fumarylacetoacetate hydrolase family protein [Actinomycetospora sp. Odt1-22]
MANSAGRLVLVDPSSDPDAPRGVDVEAASSGRFPAEPQAVYDRWEEFRRWAADADLSACTPLAVETLGPVAPRPPQVFAIGLNYSDHAAESGFDLPTEPVVFTKYASSFAGPVGDVVLSAGNVDWEVELVVVLGRGGAHIPAAQAWDHVAGLTVGQDISDRTVQFAVTPPQFGLGKSFPGYSPLGPTLATPDEVPDPDRLELGCEVNGTSVQKGTTADMVFDVPTLIAKLSAIVTLLPGDVIFTGTPAGVGQGRSPQQFLHDGDVLTSWITGLGQLRQVCRGR